MPRGPKGEKRPADVIGNAVHVMRIATAGANPYAAVQPWGSMTSIVTGASPEKPNARAAAGITSMIRPGTNGPRSLIRTTTARPLSR